MSRFVDHASLVADVLGTSVVEGEIRADLGYWEGEGAESKGISKESPSWSMFGFDSRPADPDNAGACMAVYTTDGDVNRVSGTRDLRAVSKLPDLRPGESRLYGYAGQWVRMHQDGGISMMTTDQAGHPDGNAIYVKLDPIYGVVIETPWARATVGKYGVHALDKGSGGRIDIGTVTGLPAPLDALSAYLQISTPGTLKLEGAAISLGGGSTPGLANETSVVALQTFISAVNTFALAMQTLINALVTPTAVAAPAQGTAATAALALSTASIAAATAVQNIGKPA